MPSGIYKRRLPPANKGTHYKLKQKEFVCQNCGITYNSSRMWKRIGPMCKDCVIKDMRQRQRNRRNGPNREQYLQECKDYNLKTKLENPEHFIYGNAKRRAARLNMEFNLEENDIVIPKMCPVLNLKLLPGIGKVKYNSPSIDRIDNTKGYIKGNIKIISYRANWLKCDGTIDEFEKILEYMKNEKNN